MLKYAIIYSLFLILNKASSQTLTVTYDVYGNRISKQRTSNIPKASISGDTVVCIGNIIRLQALGGDTYQWIGGPNQQSYSKVINANDTFRVIVTKGPGCKDTAKQIVKAVPTPKALPINGDSMVIVNYITNYTTNYSFGAQYIWTVTNGLILSGQNTNSAMVKWNSTPGQGNINVRVLVNEICFTDMKPKIVNINLSAKVVKSKLGELSIYPNPGRDNILIHLTRNEISPVQISIFNMIGENIFQQNFDNTFELTLPLNRSIFGSSGVFNVMIQTTDSTISQKIIITD